MARDYAPKTWNGLATQVARDVYKKLGNRIAKDMTHKYISVINNFYNDYHPRVYKRKYRSYFFADSSGVRSYTKYVKMDPDGKGFTVGLKLSPDNINTPYTSLVNNKGTRSLTNLVFENTWVRGQHGGPIPWDIVSEGYPKGKQGDRWKPYKTGWSWEPPTMDVSPMEQMDAWFANYATNDELNKLTNSIVVSSINRYKARADKRYGGLK